jgi:hypothetical protein
MIPKDQARARNDLNTASKKLATLFLDRGHAVAAGDLRRAVLNALKTFDTLKEEASP